MTYKRSIFTFLDILGFGSLVKSTEDSDRIRKILDLLGKSYKPDQDLADTREIAFLTFSDCTIRAVNIESEMNKAFPDGILWHELYSLMHTQYELLCNGLFLRGSVTIGNICIDGSLVYGPAIVQAYSLESEYAVYPRIIIDPAVFAAFESDHLLRSKRHSLAEEREFIKSVVRQDSDGLYFVDYLRGIMSEFDDEGDDLAFLELHKRTIVKNAASHKGLSKIAAKMLWLANYHNSTVRAFGKEQFEAHEDIQTYLISIDEVPLVYDVNAQ